MASSSKAPLSNTFVLIIAVVIAILYTILFSQKVTLHSDAPSYSVKGQPSARVSAKERRRQVQVGTLKLIEAKSISIPTSSLADELASTEFGYYRLPAHAANSVESEESWWWEPPKNSPNDFRMYVRNPSDAPITGLLLKINEGDCLSLTSDHTVMWNFFFMQLSFPLDSLQAAVIRADMPFTTRFHGCSIVTSLYAPLKGTAGSSQIAPSKDVKTNYLAVPLERQGNTYAAGIILNNSIYLYATVDSGATNVSLPADVVMTLVRQGTLTDNDFFDTVNYKLADGSIIPSVTFRIRSIKVGAKAVKNVVGSIAPEGADLLLGQSFLSRFKSWSIDNRSHALILD